MAVALTVGLPVALDIGIECKVIPSFVERKSVTGLFYTQLVETQDVVDLIQQYCNENNTDVISVDPEKIVPGYICIAKYSDDEIYYRGAVETFDKAKGMAKINFFDYGNKETVSLMEIAQIPDVVDLFIQQAHVCKWKNYTKQEWAKLYHAYGEEADIKIKILESAYDEVSKNTIYTVSILEIPNLEREVKAVEPLNAAVNLKEVATPKDLGVAKQSPVAPSNRDVVPEAEIPKEDKWVMKYGVMGPSTSNAPPTAKPWQKPWQKSWQKPWSAAASTKPVMASTLDQGKFKKPYTGPPVPYVKAKWEKPQTKTPTGGTATATVGTMTVAPHGQAGGDRDHEGPNSYDSMYYHCSNLLKNDPEFHAAICSAIVSCAIFFEKM